MHSSMVAVSFSAGALWGALAGGVADAFQRLTSRGGAGSGEGTKEGEMEWPRPVHPDFEGVDVVFEDEHPTSWWRGLKRAQVPSEVREGEEGAEDTGAEKAGWKVGAWARNLGWRWRKQ